jgi:Tfp pilus assembly protein PilX
VIRNPEMTIQRRGVAVIAFVTAMLVIGTMALWMLQVTSASSTSSLGHFYSTGAVYAAESGLEMALRELNHSPATDFDSDGVIGTISDDGSAATDPPLGTGAFFVQKVGASPPTYRAYGRPAQATLPWNSYTRTLEIQLQ